MSNPDLPPEILDFIVDILRDQPEALKRCCLVSKSWVPRTRKYLFAEITFRTEKGLKLWKKTFPNPSTSPAHYAKTLFIQCSQVVVAADAEPGGWITGFSSVVSLRVESRALFANGSFSLAPFHGLSPAAKSLRIIIPSLPPPQIINLVLSFPLLEDLAVTTSFRMSTDNDDGSDKVLTTVQPSSLPKFTGSLELYLMGGMKRVTGRLLSLPGGIHFQKLALTCFHEADRLAAMALVEGCSHALESLKISDCCGVSIQRMRLHRQLTSVSS
jgi:hypothetical protein